MTHRILVLYGSYRSDRMGIRLAQFIVGGLRARGWDVELIDAKAVGLPMLDRMYKEHPKGQAPAALEQLAGKIRDADGFAESTINATARAVASDSAQSVMSRAHRFHLHRVCERVACET